MRLGPRRVFEPREGATMVEFALVMPLLALVMFGIMEAGMAWHREQVVATAAREGARAAAIRNPAITHDSVVQAVQRYLAGGGVDSSTIRIDVPTWGAGPGQDQTVVLVDTLRFPVISRLTHLLPPRVVDSAVAVMRKE